MQIRIEPVVYVKGAYLLHLLVVLKRGLKVYFTAITHLSFALECSISAVTLQTLAANTCVLPHRPSFSLGQEDVLLTKRISP